MRNLIQRSISLLALISLAGCAVYVRDRPSLRVGQRRTLVAASGPRLVLVSGTSIKYCPDEEDDLFFYGGRWYVFRAGLWYSGARHTGPWRTVGSGTLPGPFLHIPMGHFKHHRGRWHPARGPEAGDGGGDEKGNDGQGTGKAKGHDKDGDGVDDHQNKKGKGHKKN